jgi:hypothetical protein
MLGLDRSFGQTTAFVSGMNHALNADFLAGFREWLIVRANKGANLGWEALARLIALPDSDAWELSPEDNERARNGFLDLLSEFLAIRAKRDGRVRVYDAYGKWLRAQSWHSPGSPLYLDNDEGATPATQ